MVNSMNCLKRKAKRKIITKRSEPELIGSAFDKIYSKMTKEEQYENLQNSLCGMHCMQGGKHTILMGSDAMDRYLNFQKQMIEKYSK